MFCKEKKTRLCLLPSCKGKRFDLVHKFPMDNERAEKWKSILNMTELKNLSIEVIRKRYFICSKHFRKEDYKNCESRNLNKTAYPRLYLSPSHMANTTPSADEQAKNYPIDGISDALFEQLPIENVVRTVNVLKKPPPQICLANDKITEVVQKISKEVRILAKQQNSKNNLVNNVQNLLKISPSETIIRSMNNAGPNRLRQGKYVLSLSVPVSAQNISSPEDNSLLDVIQDDEYLTQFNNPTILLQANNSHFVTQTNVTADETSTSNCSIKMLENFLEIHHPCAEKPFVFNYFWLRDHCRCTKCYAEKTNQSIINIMEIPLDIKPTNIEISGDELLVHWVNGHESKYDITALLKLVSSNVIDRLRTAQTPKFWRKCSIEVEKYARVSLNDYLCEDTAAKSVVESLLNYGIAFIENVPPNILSTEIAIKRLFPIQKTLFGEMWSLLDTKSHSDSAYSDQELLAHNDNTYFNDAANLQVFHCIENAESGGESLFVDGFMAIKDLEEKHPESYRQLCKVNVPAEYIEDGQHHMYCAPIIRLDPITGQVLQIRYNLADRAPMNTLPQKEMRSFYKALRELTAEIRRPDNEWWVKLTPGTVCIFNNWRVLHGRASYIGRRRLVGCYVSHTHFMSVARNFGLVG